MTTINDLLNRYQKGQMMKKLSDYTTEELERLTTLSEATALPGEFCCRYSEIRLRLEDKNVASLEGCVRGATRGKVERRVTSFTDPAELDPPQAEMLAELERRRRPVISNDTHAGRRVRRYDGLVAVVAHPAVVRAFTSAWGAQVGKVRLVSLGDGNAYTATSCDLELLD